MASPIHEALESVLEGEDLSVDAADAAMTQIMSGAGDRFTDRRVTGGAANEGREHSRNHRLRPGDEARRRAGSAHTQRPAPPGHLRYGR